jgi:two-component system CitB family sensor kinase
VTERIGDPLLGALLVAKSAVAAERGVDLKLAEDTRLDGELRDPRAALTVLGNLIDNALDAARTGAREPAVAQVGLRLLDGDVLAISVADSGAGIAAEQRERIFEPGFSTKPTGGVASRGVGLALVQQLVERRGGSVTVGDAPHGGALFEVRLPVVLRRAVEAPA